MKPITSLPKRGPGECKRHLQLQATRNWLLGPWCDSRERPTLVVMRVEEDIVMENRVVRMTVSDVALEILRKFGRSVPVWKIRRVIDALDQEEKIDVQRMGRTRTIAADDIAAVMAAINRTPGEIEVCDPTGCLFNEPSGTSPAADLSTRFSQESCLMIPRGQEGSVVSIVVTATQVKGQCNASQQCPRQ